MTNRPIILRDYQQEAVAAVTPFRPRQRDLIQAPTGAGKSLIAAALAEDAAFWSGGRALIVTHVKELVAQNEIDLRRFNASIDAGVYCSGLDRRELGHAVTIASIQSIHRRLDAWRDCSLIIVDEAHRIPRDEGVHYRALMDFAGDTPVVGLTATPFRHGSGRLDEGDDALFDSIVFEIGFNRLVAAGHLVTANARGSELAYSDATLHMRAGDFKSDELAELANDDGKTAAIVDELVSRASGRAHWLIFAVNVKHAQTIARMLRERGVPTGLVTGDSGDRDESVAAFKRGEIRALVNCNVLTTGFNFPALDCIALARPMGSLLLYVQACGRGTRPAPGKTDFLLLDYGGNIQRHGHFDDPKPRAKRKTGDGQAPVKKCPACGEINHAAVRQCAVCGAAFPPPEPDANLSATADVLSLLNDGFVTVSAWSACARETQKAGLGVIVTYKTSGGRVTEWVFPEGGAFVRQKFVTWCASHGFTTAPFSAAQAVYQINNNKGRMPTAIKVMKDGKYDRITQRRFT